MNEELTAAFKALTGFGAQRMEEIGMPGFLFVMILSLIASIFISYLYKYIWVPVDWKPNSSCLSIARYFGHRDIRNNTVLFAALFRPVGRALNRSLSHAYKGTGRDWFHNAGNCGVYLLCHF